MTEDHIAAPVAPQQALAAFEEADYPAAPEAATSAAWAAFDGALAAPALSREEQGAKLALARRALARGCEAEAEKMLASLARDLEGQAGATI